MKRLKDRDDIYLEVKSSEQRRKRKRLSPRVVILPDWDMSVEDRYDEDQARRRTRAAAKKRRTNNHNRRECADEKVTSPFHYSSKSVPGRRYRGVQGKVVYWVEHNFEEGLLYIHVRFTDKAELSWRIATRMTIEESDLADWTSGDFKQLRVFVRNERDRSVMHRNVARAYDYLKREHDRIRAGQVKILAMKKTDVWSVAYSGGP